MGAADENDYEADVSVELVEEDLDGVAGGNGKFDEKNTGNWDKHAKR
ncbi:hypothetical protein [Streptomyces capitiformicae]|uniref:Uncharacterized protein n=1 Tax=Streptomyces capitiformicae TaxID=2014920 RepID=A0A919DPQ3_9ACTN|nr:hypothetical protein [Streptomyces capitiformicae]GHE64285.1 hypothetical protein GCM10017771_87690 [Streptomyces capitiformicae]